MLKIEKDDKIYPFSKGILARSILPTGLSVSTVYDIVEDVQAKFGDKKEPISSSDINEKVAQILHEKGLIKEKKRYLVSRELAQIQKPIVILIGGVAGVGKSTVAAALARRLGISRVIDTDEIREIMRYSFPKDLMPELHESSFNAGDVMDGPEIKNDELVGFNRQARLVNRGVHAYIRRVTKEGIKAVFNGVHLLPGLIEIDDKDDSANHFYYLITLDDKKDHIQRFHLRAKHSYRKAERYIDKIEEIRKIQDYMVNEAKESGTKIIENLNMDDTVTKIVDDLIDKMQD